MTVRIAKLELHKIQSWNFAQKNQSYYAHTVDTVGLIKF